MATPQQRLLFSWDDIELLPDLQRLKLALDNLPDEAMVSALERMRGKGRMTAKVGLALAVMMALALGGVKVNAPERMRSLIRPPSALAA